MKYLILTTLGTLVFAVIGVALWDSWRNARQVIEDTENELPDEQAPWPDDVYEILSIVMCTRCSEEPSGTCTCGIACPHPACVFDQAVLTGLNRDELDFLRGEREMPEKRDAL